MNQGSHYYVLGADNLKHGPADLNTLRMWANEGRILGSTLVFDEAGNEYTASQLLPQLFGNHIPPPNPNQPSNTQIPHQIQQDTVNQQGQAVPPPPGSYVPPTQIYNDPYSQDPLFGGSQYGPGISPRRNRWFGGSSYGGGWSGYGGGGMGFGGGWGESLGWLLALFFCCNVFFAVFAVFFAHRALIAKFPLAKLMLGVGYLNLIAQLGYSLIWHLHH